MLIFRLSDVKNKSIAELLSNDLRFTIVPDDYIEEYNIEPDAELEGDAILHPKESRYQGN